MKPLNRPGLLANAFRSQGFHSNIGPPRILASGEARRQYSVRGAVDRRQAELLQLLRREH